MRIAIGGIWHETNTFSSVPADYAAFENDALLRGNELRDEYAHSNATVAGFLDAANHFGFEAVPLVHARTGPIGTITSAAFERLCDELTSLLRSRGPWAAVLLANHGAAVSANYSDADGEIARRVRHTVGPDVPVGMALDMHANISAEMARHTTVLNTYQTNPHLDARSRAFEVAAAIVATVRGQLRPVQCLVTPPLVINITRQCTADEPMRTILDTATRIAARPGLISVSAVEGYPYADVEEMGMSFHVVADRDYRLARDGAWELATTAWACRDQMLANLDPLDSTLAFAKAASSGAGPVVVMDVGDNIPGGSSADSTVLLAAARAMQITDVLQTVFDPDCVQRCWTAGIGVNLALTVGGKTDRLHGAPMEVRARVLALDQGRYEDPGPTHGGFRHFDDGQRALVETTDGATLLLTSKRSGNLSLEQWYSIGVRPQAYSVVIAKGVVSPRPAYEPIASRILLANTPGLTTADLASLEFVHRRRPLFPFESDAQLQNSGSNSYPLS